MADTRHDALWRRVEAHLDARTDPFHDAALARELRATPEAEHAARRMMARLGALRAIGSSAPNASERGVGIAGSVHAAARTGRARSRPARRLGALAACAACAAAAVWIGALVRDDAAPRGRSDVPDAAADGPSKAVAAVTAHPELGVVYSASIEVERSVPPPPRAALVVHESRQVLGWSLAGNPR